MKKYRLVTSAHTQFFEKQCFQPLDQFDLYFLMGNKLKKSKQLFDKQVF